MPLTDTQLRYYDANVLRLDKDARKKYHTQVDTLISTLNTGLKYKTGIIVNRAVKAGSFAKHTILRRAVDKKIDVDVVFYVHGPSVDDTSLEALTDEIFAILSGMYPNKQIGDFELSSKAATVSFVGTGISVDVVPVIENAKRKGYGWQFDTKTGAVTETCAPCQIQFVRSRKDIDKDFRTLVRLAKMWRTFNEVDKLKSFTIELILAHLADTDGVKGSLQQRFLRFLDYIAESELQQVISFPENSGYIPVFNDPVVIIDPVCNDNNVTSRLSDSERADIVNDASNAWEAASYAAARKDYTIWKEEIFGPRFKVEES